MSIVSPNAAVARISYNGATNFYPGTIIQKLELFNLGTNRVQKFLMIKKRRRYVEPINAGPFYGLDCGMQVFILKSMANPRKPRPKCPVCKKEPARSYYKYCSNKCQLEYQRRLYIENWKAGKEHGLQSLGIVSTLIKKYLREKFGNKCCLCGWSKINPKTGTVPLVADHIDGNWRNNIEKNLRLICPNCDSLTPTYAGLNRGNGRKNRVLSKRAKEARMLSAK